MAPRRWWPLVLTVSTVEAALSKIYRKLGVRSRTELATHTSRARRTHDHGGGRSPA